MFKIGQRVLCISDKFDSDACVAAGVCPPHKAIWPVPGRWYTICAVRRPRCKQWPNGAVLGLVLVELPAPLGFDARAFEILNEQRADATVAEMELA